MDESPCRDRGSDILRRVEGILERRVKGLSICGSSIENWKTPALAEIMFCVMLLYFDLRTAKMLCYHRAITIAPW